MSTNAAQHAGQAQRTFMAITVASECTLLSVRLLRLHDTCGRADMQVGVCWRDCFPHMQGEACGRAAAGLGGKTDRGSARDG